MSKSRTWSADALSVAIGASSMEAVDRWGAHSWWFLGFVWAFFVIVAWRDLRSDKPKPKIGRPIGKDWN